MKVQVRLYATLARHLPENREGNSCTMEVGERTNIGDLLTELQIPLHAPKIIMLNGVHADVKTVLRDGDRLAVFPPIAGG